MFAEPGSYNCLEPQSESALLLHQRYFEVFETVVSTLMEPGGQDAPSEALSVVIEACHCSVGAVFLDAPDRASSRLAFHRTHPQSDTAIPAGSFRRIHYVDMQALADMLEVGMVLNAPLQDLPPRNRRMLSPYGVKRIICLPLLERGTAFGFISLLDIGKERIRTSAELHFLAMLANVFAQALLKQRAELEIQVSQQRLLALVGATQDMVFEVDETGVIEQIWSGHSALPSPDVLVGGHLSDVLPPDMACELVQALPMVLHELRSVQVNCTVRNNGVAVYFLIRLSPLSADGHTHAVAMVQDVSSIMQEAVQRKTMLDTLNLLEEAVIDLSPRGELVATTPAWARLRGIDPLHASADMGKPLQYWVQNEDREALIEVISALQGSEKSKTQRFRLLRYEAEPIWVEARLIAYCSPDGTIQGLRGVIRDVTVAHLNEQHITKLALYDTLTHLPNRLMLDDELHQAISRAKRCNGKVALGFIDLDHFKEVNDAFGHKIGDELLVNVANRLSGALRGQGILARWGGDEFIALIPDVADIASLRGVAETLRQAAQLGVMLDEVEAHPTISVGFALYPDNAGDAEELLSAADHTMYHAKNAGRNNVCFYSDILHFKAFGREHLAIQARLSGAIQDDTLQVFYQPIVDVSDGSVLALEALARWQDGRGGWISPDLFIPMAEKAGLIQELSDRIMAQGFAQLSRWRNAGLTQPLTFNISRSQLFSANFLSCVQERLAVFGLRPQDVILEITESVALTDYARQMRHLRQFMAAGFRIAIDDFGTGYSSLSQLHEMPVQFLKIDASFAQRLNTEDGRGVMQAIIQLAQLLKLKVVVEGVEDREAASYLKFLGVRGMQGFYYSEPVPSVEAECMMLMGVMPRDVRETMSTIMPGVKSQALDG